MILFKPKYISVNDQSALPKSTFRGSRPVSRQSPDHREKNKEDSSPVNDLIEAFKNPKQNIKNLLLSGDELNEEDGWYIYQQLKHYKFFLQFIRGNEEKEDLDPCVEFCKNLKYWKSSAGTILIRQGEESDGRVYLVLTGEVTVISKNASVHKEAGVNILKEWNTPRDDEKGNEQDNWNRMDSPRLERKDSPAIAGFDRKDSDEPTLERQNSTSIKEPNSATESPSKRMMKRQKTNKNIRDKTNSTATSNNQSQFDSTDRRSPFSRKASSNFEIRSIKAKDLIPVDGKSNAYAIASRNEFGIVKDIIGEGGYFGDKAKKRMRRRATIIANTDVELLSFTEEQLSYLQRYYTISKQEFLNFLRDSFFMSKDIETDVLLDTMEVLQVARGDKITTQGQFGDHLYIIYQGECEVLKEIVYDDTSNVVNKMGDLNVHYRMKKTQKEVVPAGIIASGSFLGIEAFYNDSAKWEFTVKVSTRKAILLGFKKDKVLFRFPRKTFLLMNEKHKPLYQSHLETLKSRLETKGCRLDLLELTHVFPIIRRIGLGHSKSSSKISYPLPIPKMNDEEEDIEEEISIIKHQRDNDSPSKTAYPSNRRSMSPRISPELSSTAQEKFFSPIRKVDDKADNSFLPELNFMMRSHGPKQMLVPREEDYRSYRKFEAEKYSFDKFVQQNQKDYLEKTLKRAAAILNNSSKKSSLLTIPPDLRISSNKGDKLDLDPEKFHNFGKQLNSYLDRVQEHYNGIDKVINDPNYSSKISGFKFGFLGPDHLEKLHQIKSNEIKNNFAKKQNPLLASARNSIDPTVSSLPKSPSQSKLDSPKGDFKGMRSPSRDLTKDYDPLNFNDYPDASINPVLKSLKTFLDTLKSPRTKIETKMQMKSTVGGFLFDGMAKKKLRERSNDFSQINSTQNNYQQNSTNNIHLAKNNYSNPASPRKIPTGPNHGLIRGSNVLRKKNESLGMSNVHLGRHQSVGVFHFGN